MEPEYAKAASKLKKANSQVKLAKVDATVEEELAERFEVGGFPTLKFFNKGAVIDYRKGGRNEADILAWINKKTTTPAKELATAEEVKAFTDGRDVAVIGFFTDRESDLAKAFINVADGVDEVDFGIAAPSSSGELAVTKDRIVLTKKFDDLRVDYSGKADAEEIINFIKLESIPLVIEFSEKTKPLIVGADIKTHCIFFCSKEKDNYDAMLAA